MVILIVCTLMLAALWMVWAIHSTAATDELTPEPVRVRYEQIRRR